MRLILGIVIFVFSAVLVLGKLKPDLRDPDTFQARVKKYFLQLFQEEIAKGKYLSNPENRKQSSINRRFGGNEFQPFGDNKEHPENNEIVEKLTEAKTSQFTPHGYGHVRHQFHHHKHNHTNDHKHLHNHAQKHDHMNDHNEKFMHIHNHKHLHKHDHHHDHDAGADHDHDHAHDHKHQHGHQKIEEWRRSGAQVISNYNW